MKKYLFHILPSLVLISLVALNACKKNEPAANTATIEITSPQEGQMFAKGDTVHITATLTGQLNLHGWEVAIRKKADNTVVYTNSLHVHDLILQVNDFWINDVTEDTGMVLEVSAQLDHEGTLASKTVNFHALPM